MNIPPSVGILLTRDQLEAWAGRTLTTAEIAEIDDAISWSTVPEAIEGIARSIGQH